MDWLLYDRHLGHKPVKESQEVAETRWLSIKMCQEYTRDQITVKNVVTLWVIYKQQVISITPDCAYQSFSFSFVRFQV